MWLSFTSGSRAGDTVEVHGADFTIGRDSSCDLVVDDEKVSRRHVAIQALSGAAELSDLGSSNGTYINGDRVVGSVSLQGGEHLRLGGAEFDVLATDPAAPAPTGGGPKTVVGEATMAPEPISAPEPSSRAAPAPPPAWDSAQRGAPAPVGAPPIAKRRSQKAVWALVLGIAGILLGGFGLILGPVAIWLGVSARNEVRQDEYLEGDGMALAGTILGAIAIVTGIVSIIIIAG